MDVAITELRAHLGDWIDRARAGEQIVVTDRGLPVARLSGLESTSLMERLIADGVAARPKQAKRPRSGDWSRVTATGSISDLVTEQRAQGMTDAYFDSSALVKLLVDEDGSQQSLQLWDACDLAVSSRLAYPEVCAALAAARRDGRLTNRRIEAAQESWEFVWSATVRVELSDAVERAAGGFARAHALSGADAVHLASALAVRAPDFVFAAWDRRLRAGAVAEGLAVVPA